MFEFDRERVLSYLVGRGFLSPSELAQVVVRDLSRQNRNFAVIRPAGTSYLVKQSVDEQARAGLADEGEFYARVQTNGLELSEFLPRSEGFDEETGALTLEFLADTETLEQRSVRTRRASRTTASAMGQCLALLHESSKLMLDASAVINSKPPWVLAVHRPDAGLVWAVSRATVDLLRIVQQHPEFGEAFDDLSATWGRRCFVHLDAKFDNWLVTTAPRDERTVKLVDWELARPGEPAWDVGVVLASYLLAWLGSMPLTGVVPTRLLASLASMPLSRVQAATRTFLRAYQARTSSQTRGPLFIRRSVRFAAARLVQAAFERTIGYPQLTAFAVCALQLSSNLILRPDDAVGGLLGFDLRALA